MNLYRYWLHPNNYNYFITGTSMVDALTKAQNNHKNYEVIKIKLVESNIK